MSKMLGVASGLMTIVGFAGLGLCKLIQKVQGVTEHEFMASAVGAWAVWALSASLLLGLLVLFPLSVYLQKRAGVHGRNSGQTPRPDPMSFRIALGACDCSEPYADKLEKVACGLLRSLLESWRGRLPDDLSSVPTEAYAEEIVDGHTMTIGTHRHETENGDVLVVVQVLIHTWSKPTFFSLGAVGRMYAEGLIVASDGSITPAPDEELWDFR